MKRWHITIHNFHTLLALPKTAFQWQCDYDKIDIFSMMQACRESSRGTDTMTFLYQLDILTNHWDTLSLSHIRNMLNIAPLFLFITKHKIYHLSFSISTYLCQVTTVMFQLCAKTINFVVVLFSCQKLIGISQNFAIHQQRHMPQI